MQYIYRLILACVIGLGLFALLPHVLNIFQVHNSDLEAVLKISIGIGALIYVIFGRPINWPNPT